MPEYLKGNYKAPKIKAAAPEPKDAPAGKDGFEDRAMERLGGSIAFVMKSKTFLWTAPKNDDGKKK